MCDKCNSTNIEIHETIGRGLPPKNHVDKGRRISWKGVWQVFKCECGNVSLFIYTQLLLFHISLVTYTFSHTLYQH